jgi:hypothetical protein
MVKVSYLVQTLMQLVFVLALDLLTLLEMLVLRSYDGYIGASAHNNSASAFISQLLGLTMQH